MATNERLKPYRPILHRAGVDPFLSKPDIQGKRKELYKDRGDEINATLPAGTYLMRVEFKDDRAPKEVEVVVAAGERVEVTVE